jgi:hypothetical protein
VVDQAAIAGPVDVAGVADVAQVRAVVVEMLAAVVLRRRNAVKQIRRFWLCQNDGRWCGGYRGKKSPPF